MSITFVIFTDDQKIGQDIYSVIIYQKKTEHLLSRKSGLILNIYA